MTSPPVGPPPPLPPPLPPAPLPHTRRAEIALAAAEEFARRGYHATRVDHIAESLGVTPGALYRHVPGKYEMFTDATALLIRDLDAATTVSPTSDAGTDELDRIVDSVTRTTLTHRGRAALYRWQVRYLAPDDRVAVEAAGTRIRRRVADAVRAHRRSAGLEDPGGAGSCAAAILACVASLATHRIAVTESEAVGLMTSIAHDLATASPGQLPAPRAPRRSTPESPTAAPPRLRGGAATREGAITAAIERFHSSGYDSVTMEAIGADVGVAASALYRHFPSKSALLTASVDRTAALVGDLLDRHSSLHSAGSEPAEVLGDLLDQYVTIAFSHGPELILYHSELGALAPEDRRRIRCAQRRQLDRWAGLVLDAARARTGVDTDESTARIRVQAALAVVLDGGQGTGFHPAAAPRFGELAGVTLLPG
jgi:AcrR family transcriptional regulator